LDVNQQLLDNDLQVDVNGGLGLNSRASDFFVGTPIKSLVRYTYRNIETPGGTSATGNSELMWLLLPKDLGTGRFGIGPVINFPTDENQFGADVWHFGLGSVVIQNSLEGKLLWGLLVQQVWGQTKVNSDSVYASPIAIQPFATYSINDNWYISNGEAPWVFNWQKKEWLIPLGVRVGRLFNTRKGTWNGYVKYRRPIVWKGWPGAVAEDTVRVQGLLHTEIVINSVLWKIIACFRM
jgi:hypothetical protein